MKITEKGFYRTRGGDVAFVGVLNDGGVEGTVLDWSFCFWHDNGRLSLTKEETNDLVELIKPYSEELLK